MSFRAVTDCLRYWRCRTIARCARGRGLTPHNASMPVSVVFGASGAIAAKIKVTGKKLSDFKLLLPTDLGDFESSHAAFVKEWNGIMGL